MRRSRNSYIVSPRRVTIAPIGIPSRTLKAAMDFLALVVTGFWPAIAARSATRGSMILTFWVASPRPMLITIFSSFGITIAFVMPSSFAIADLISVLYLSLKRAAMIALFAFSTAPELAPAGGVPFRGVNLNYSGKTSTGAGTVSQGSAPGKLALLVGDDAARILRDANLLVALDARAHAGTLAL